MTTVTVPLPSLTTEIEPATQEDLTSNEDPAEPEQKIVHAIRGRIRFYIPKLRYDLNYACRLQALLKNDSCFTWTRINRVAASLIINYHSDYIPDDKIRSHVNYLILAATQSELVLETIPGKSPQLSFDCQISALATGLAVLSGPVGLPIPSLIVVGSIFWATWPVLQRAVNAIIHHKKLTIDFLDLIAIVITTSMGNYLTPSLMLALISIGENIRDRTARSSEICSSNLLNSWEQFVWVECDGKKQQIPLQEIVPGDTILLHPGEQVPIDGSILQGKVLLDEQKLTGESMPVVKSKGQSVFASTLVREGGCIHVLVERMGNDTRVGQSMKLIQEAPVHDTRMENYATKIAEKAVLPTLLLAASVLVLSRNLARAASVLTLDFATGIRVSVPTTVLAALTYAAKQGVLIRSGRTLEKLADIDTIIFDKTGTLTQGEVKVISVESFSPSLSHLQILELAAAAEHCLLHPVAQAIMRQAIAQEIIIPPRSYWHYHLGLGVEAIIKDEQVLVGSDRFLSQQGVNMSHVPKQKSAESVIYVASNGQLLGKITYRDVLRNETRAVIHQLLKVAGIEVHLLTGDNQHTANAVAEELGICSANTHAEAFPSQKAEVVQRLHDQGKIVAFVGDGVNDSPALAYADVSVSFANSSDIARETADVVLMENDLSGLLTAMAIARRASQLVQQNTAIVAIPNLAAMAIAVTFGLSPLVATVVNNGSTIVAGFNGLRPMLTRSNQKNSNRS